MERNFGMGMFAHERLGFETDRPVAEGSAFRAAAHDADVARLGGLACHTRASICCRKRSFFSTARNEASKELRASSRNWSSEKPNS